MFSKRIFSVVMILALLLTMAAIPATYAASGEIASTSVNTADDYVLASSIQNGNILHAFNWKISEIEAHASEIAAAGYSAVQLSPIQQTKATANDGTFATDWWSFYQPTDMSIGNALGDAAGLKSMCDELHKYGIKVICDVVTNHVQNSTSRSEAANINSTLLTYLRRPGGVTNSTAANDSSRANQVQLDMDAQLPDIDTSNTAYQNYVFDNLLSPMLDAGVDGFRFDAAKHIETPDDGSVASQYWPNITSKIKAKNSGAYIYGEVLASGGQFNISSYTKYINVTDYAYGATVRSALTSKNASALSSYGYTGSSSSQNVLWVESHDNFCDLTSTSLTQAQQIQGWAIIGARKDAPALYLVRPNCESLDSKGFIKYDEFMGYAGASSTWKSTPVVAVNQFKNAFEGQSESVSTSGALFFVQRGTTGMVIVNVGGGSTSISQSCSMASGTYTDQVSGSTFTVSGGKISGTVGSSGVAVVYNKSASNSAPAITAKLGSTDILPNTLRDYTSSVKTNPAENRYTTATATVTITLSNATSGTVSVNGVSGTLSAGSNTITFSSSIPYGTIINITVTAKNGSKTISNTYTVVKKSISEAKVAYFENKAAKIPVGSNTGGNEAGIYVFQKTGVAASTKLGNWPGTKLTLVSGTLYSASINSSANYVKFNEGFIPDTTGGDTYTRKHLGHSFSECQGYCGRTFPQTVIPYGDAKYAANRENGGYQIVGAMILDTNIEWRDYMSTSAYTAKTLGTSDVTLPGGSSTQPSTATTPSSSETSGSGSIMRGDADMSNFVDITDATRIQQHLARLSMLSADGEIAADVDGEDGVTITDATYVQRYLAHYPDPFDIGAYISTGTSDVTIATTPIETQQPTSAPRVLERLSNKFVAIIYCEAAGTDDASRNTEQSFSEYGVLTYEFQGPSYVFVRNYDTGIQYATNGWSNFANPATLINENALTDTFDKMYVPAGTYTLYLSDNGNDTFSLEYEAGAAADLPTSSTSSGGSGGSYDVYFTTSDWTRVYAYVWTTSSGAEAKAWPGIAMEFVETNPYGQRVYKFTIDPQYDNIIYNDGSGKQTVDLKLDGTPNMGYYISGQDSSGKYTCGTYVYGVES